MTPRLSCTIAVVALALGIGMPAAGAVTRPAKPPAGLIAFVDLDATGTSRGIAVVGTDGRGKRLVTHGQTDASPAWSRDGKRIALSRNGDIYTVGVDGRRLKRVTYGPTEDGRPTWSPDGREIAFSRARDELAMPSLMIVRADGRGLRKIPTSWGLDNPAWSPSGEWIAATEVGDPSEIALLPPAGGGEADLRYPVDDDDSDDGMADWSPDGKRLAFNRYMELCERACDYHTVWVGSIDGSDIRPLAHDSAQQAWDPSWSPDGKWVVAETSDGLLIFDAATGRSRKLLPEGPSEPAWQPRPRVR